MLQSSFGVSVGFFVVVGHVFQVSCGSLLVLGCGFFVSFGRIFESGSIGVVTSGIFGMGTVVSEVGVSYSSVCATLLQIRYRCLGVAAASGCCSFGCFGIFFLFVFVVSGPSVG